MMENTRSWSNRQGHRNRQAWCLVAGPDDRVRSWEEAIDDRVIAVIDEASVREGKWSHTTYTFTLKPGARFLSGHMGWNNNTWRESLTDRWGKVERWPDVSRVLGVSVGAAQEYLHKCLPRDAAHFDLVDAALAEIDDAITEVAGAPAETVVSFGAPTNRQIADGFWEYPVVIRNTNGEVVGFVRPVEKKDCLISYVQSDGSLPVHVLDQTHVRGYHGGYWSVRLALPEGWTAAHEPQSVF